MSKKKSDESGEGKRVESKYNSNQLRQCIQEGLPANEIMEKLGIKHKQTLKQFILKLMSDDRTYYEVRGLYLKSSTRPKVNAKMDIKISLRDIDFGDIEIAPGDEFSVSVEEDRLVLTRV